MELYDEIARFLFIVNFVIAVILFRARPFAGRGWFVLAFLAWGVAGLLWFAAPDWTYQSGLAMTALLNLTAMVTAVIGALALAGRKVSGLKDLARGGGAVDLSSDQATSMIPRNESNSISRAEAVRDRIYDQLCDACRKERIAAEVFKSPPFSPTIWVEVRVQEPLAAQSATELEISLRATATVTVEPREFHRFDHELTVVLNDSRKRKTYGSVIELTPAHASEVCRYLANKTRSLSLRLPRCRRYPWQLWRPKNKLVRLKPARSIAAILAVLGMLLLALPVLGVPLLIAAFPLWLYEREKRRRIFSLTPGKPKQEPRMLLRMDSWQSVLSDLAPHAGELAAQVRAALQKDGQTLPSNGREAPGSFEVGDEDVWYLGIDGKVERRQIVVRLRRAIGFVHLYPYGNDLYVGWDAHLNGGTWVEKLLGEGREPGSGKIVRAYGIASTWHTPHEYDINDADVLIENVHSVVTKMVKRALKEHAIDQDIDFSIVRESRQDIAGRKNPEAREEEKKKRPRLRRVA